MTPKEKLSLRLEAAELDLIASRCLKKRAMILPQIAEAPPHGKRLLTHLDASITECERLVTVARAECEAAGLHPNPHPALEHL